MAKLKYDFPLSLDEIGSFLKNEYDILKEVEGIVIVPAKSTNLSEDIRTKIFRNVFDYWNKEDGVVVGKNKLLCEVKLNSFNILEESTTIQNKRVLLIKAELQIIADPGHTKAVEEDFHKTKKMLY